MIKHYLSVIVVILWAAGPLRAQSCEFSITTPDQAVCEGTTLDIHTEATPLISQLYTITGGGSSQRGNMFDLAATNTVNIYGFDVYPQGSTTVEVYYRPTPYAGFETNAAGWTLLVSAPAIWVNAWSGVNIPFHVTIPAGQTYSFYVTSTDQNVSLNYTGGSGEGQVFSSDPNLTFYEGVGLSYPFTNGTGSIFTPRIWNGIIHYVVEGATVYDYTWSTSETTANIQKTINEATQYNVALNMTGCPTLYDTIHVTAKPYPVVQGGADQITCPGSPVLLTASGADTYVWSNGAINGVFYMPLVSGNCIVTGTTNGCSETDTVFVDLYDLPEVNAGADYNVCAGSTTILSGSGAQAYVWNNGVINGVAFTPLAPADYRVMGLDENGCIHADTVHIGIEMLPSIDAGADVTVCAGAEVMLHGDGPANISWNNGVVDGEAFDALIDGPYVVTGTGLNGCTNTDTLMMTLNAPEVTQTAFAAACENTGTILLTGGNPSGGTYSGTGVTGNTFDPAAGTQTISYTYTDGDGCTGEAVTTLQINAAPNTTFVVPVSSVCLENGVVALSGGSPANGNYSGTGVTNADFNPVTAGIGIELITYSYTDANGCTATAIDTIDVTSCLGIAEHTHGTLQVYPNPGNGLFTIALEAGQQLTALQIFDAQGKLVENTALTDNGSTGLLDLTHVEKGMYLLRGMLNGEMIQVRLIKQ